VRCMFGKEAGATRARGYAELYRNTGGVPRTAVGYAERLGATDCCMPTAFFMYA